jgi:cyclopropane fatty-acyl-phospholipid synthase-like methyltransferase
MGIDFSKPAVDKAGERARALGLHNRVHFSTRALSEINETFDYIVMSDVVEHLSDTELEEIFAKCRQITGTGGSIIIHTPNGRSSKYRYCRERLRIFNLYYEFKHLRRMWFGDEVVYLKDAYYDQTHINVMGPKHLTTLLHNAGFINVTISFDKDVPTFLRWLDLGTMCAIAR